MGTAHRLKPRYLAEKLKMIREELGLTYKELIDRLNCPSVRLYRASISQYENGRREPPLVILLQYARLANVLLEVLVDDELDLPSKLPCKHKSAGTVRTADSTES